MYIFRHIYIHTYCRIILVFDFNIPLWLCFFILPLSFPPCPWMIMHRRFIFLFRCWLFFSLISFIRDFPVFFVLPFRFLIPPYVFYFLLFLRLELHAFEYLCQEKTEHTWKDMTIHGNNFCSHICYLHLHWHGWRTLRFMSVSFYHAKAGVVFI